ncbi:MAG TPA: hypothetical protein EYG82_01910 [Sulfurovum sp.]|nr:hypothetical protein [Sulfurovum sp.]
MQNKALRKIHTRIAILSRLNIIETEQSKIDMQYASIESDILQDVGHTEDEYLYQLEVIETNMFRLEKEYYELEASLFLLSQI